MKRKYPEVVGWWVYSIQVPSINKYYIGISKLQCYQRWQKSQYKNKSLSPYLEEWDSMVKTVLVDNLTKEQAYQYEGNIIQALSMNNLCINEQRSGLITDDINAYYKQYYENNKEKVREKNKEYRENNKEREKQRVKQWHENNKEKWNDYQREWQKQYYERNKESINEKRRQRYQKKKLENQQQQVQLTLFDLESFDIAS